MKDIVKIEDLREKARHLIDLSVSESTKKAYRSDWHVFSKWCQKYEVCALPATSETITLFITSLEGYRSLATIRRYLSTISVAHRSAGMDSPCSSDTVKRTLAGIAKSDNRKINRASPISWETLCKMIDVCGTSGTGHRDATLLLLGWTGALRRSELVSIQVDDIEFVKHGMIVTIRRAKTDQEGKGVEIGIPKYSDEKYCAVVRMRLWLKRFAITNGPVFRHLRRDASKWWIKNRSGKQLSDKAVSNIVKKYVEKIGGNRDRFSGHSLRRGFITEAASCRVPNDIIQRHTRHASIETLQKYVDRGTIFVENPVSEVFSHNS